MRRTGVLIGKEIFYSWSENRTSFALALSNNSPMVYFDTPAGTRYYAGANAAIPTNEWTHLAGVWDSTK